jgi:CBS-domain-containing membrane protein
MGDEVTLKEYMLAQIGLHAKQIDSVLAAQDKAVMVARDDMNRRLEGMNEFRRQLDTQAKTFVTHADVDATVLRLNVDLREAVARIDTELKSLTKSRDENSGKASAASVYIAWILAGITLILGIINLIKG